MKGEVIFFSAFPCMPPGFLVPSPYLPAGQGSQSDSLVAPVLGPKVPFGHGCSVLKLVPGRQKYPEGHSSGVCAPEPRIQRIAPCSGDMTRDDKQCRSLST